MISNPQELFAAAASDAPPPTGLAERVLASQRRVDRRRRVLGVLGAAALVLGGGTLHQLTSGASGQVYVALGADGTVTIAEPACKPGEMFAAPLELTAVTPGQRLRSTDPRYVQQSERATREDDCTTSAAIPLTLAATAPDGSVLRALTVNGPLPQPARIQGRAVAVRGTQGQVTTGPPDPAEATALSWTDQDERSWYVLASGYTVAELVNTVDALAITASAVTLPGTDLTDYGQSPARPAGSSVRWFGTYRASTGVEFDAVTYPSTRTLLGDFTGPRGNSRLVQVEGRPAIVTSNGTGLGDALQNLTLELAPGVWMEARAVDVQPDELMAFASTLVPTQQQPGT